LRRRVYSMRHQGYQNKTLVMHRKVCIDNIFIYLLINYYDYVSVMYLFLVICDLDRNILFLVFFVIINIREIIISLAKMSLPHNIIEEIMLENILSTHSSPVNLYCFVHCSIFDIYIIIMGNNFYFLCATKLC
jgi:hypothetical protein